MKEKAMIAMSGGVDSAVAAFLMKEQGYICTGITMKLFASDDDTEPREHSCCSLQDIEDARQVCRQIGIPHYVYNFKDDFDSKVIGRFAQAYMQGRTPNPCIDCNRFIKFQKLLERALVLDMDTVVTGHYARVENDPETGGFLLKKALDPDKDQSYVLYYITQSQLSHIQFPLGNMTKQKVRALATKMNIPVADKPDSQDICFVPDRDYASFIERYSGSRFRPGRIVDAAGKAVGQHHGIIRYTIGQRRGLHLPNGTPVYVTGKDMQQNTISVGADIDLFHNALHADDLCWISGKSPQGAIRMQAKIRYRQTEEPAVAQILSDGRMQVVFDEPQRAITPGQAVVFYDGDVVLGGGTILDSFDKA